MSIFVESDVRARARKSIADDMVRRKSNFSRSSAEILKEAALASLSQTGFDMFLSHSIKDAELVLGVKGILEDMGYKTYVDWINDPTLDRGNVTASTADTLRRRMRSSASLFYITTSNSEQSRWMPWECGYFDGFREKVAILPIKSYVSNYFEGLEYLGLYPYCTKEASTLGVQKLWIHRSASSYTSYDNWVATKKENIEWR